MFCTAYEHVGMKVSTDHYLLIPLVTETEKRRIAKAGTKIKDYENGHFCRELFISLFN